MHFHLPKALHGWRELAKEISIIVVGVLLPEPLRCRTIPHSRCRANGAILTTVSFMVAATRWSVSNRALKQSPFLMRARRLRSGDQRVNLSNCVLPAR